MDNPGGPGGDKCRYPALCTKCMQTVTLAQCQSFGIDCVQICDGGSVHRRMQGSGAAAAAQVSANKASTARFKQLMDCLAEGSALGATMVPPASCLRLKCVPEYMLS